MMYTYDVWFGRDAGNRKTDYKYENICWFMKFLTWRYHISLILSKKMNSSVMRVGSDTFGDPIFQKSLQN